MLLSPQDVKLFFTLYRSLLVFVNERLKVVADDANSQAGFDSHSAKLCHKVRNAFLQNTDLLGKFVEENPARLAGDELDVVRSWRHLVHGMFYVLRQHKNRMVFLTSQGPPIAYEVVGLSQTFDELLGPHLPVAVDTVLLPFRDVITYDGLLWNYRVSFGPGYRRSINERYQEAKARHGIVMALPMSPEPLPPKVPKPRQVRPPARAANEEVVQAILGLIDQFCAEHLNEEYAVLCRKLAKKLGRKRPCPLLRGSPNAWASGIVRVVGGVNFLHDKSQVPYLRAADIDHHLGTSPSSGASKAAAIRRMIKISPFQHEWILPSRMEDNPLIWTLQVNGMLVDVRDAPREVQEIAFQKGLIPYVPAAR